MSNQLFAAYGVGLNRGEMAMHCPTAKLLGMTELKNFRLIFRGGNARAVATIAGFAHRTTRSSARVTAV